MTNEEIVQALRCTSTPGDHASNCEQCPYWKKEQLDGRLKEKLGTDTWASCDIDKIGLDAADLIERLTAENAAPREKNWGCRQQMSEKLYGAYLTSVQNVREAKLELAKQAARCVERVMLDDDMFLVKGDTVGWKVRIYRNESDNYVEELP